MKSTDSNYYLPDGGGIVYPYVATPDWNHQFRTEVVLDEPVDLDRIRRALEIGMRNTGVKYIEAAAAVHDDELAVFVVNRDWNDDAEFTLDVEGFKGYEFVEQSELYSDDINARNTWENENVVVPKKSDNAAYADGKVTTVLKKLSFNMFHFNPAGAMGRSYIIVQINSLLHI